METRNLYNLNGRSFEKIKNPVLFNAVKVLNVYKTATETAVRVLDQNYFPITEAYDSHELNPCLCCEKCFGGKSPEPANPSYAVCNSMHINAIKEAYRFGGSYIYICDIGFLFWTSPIFSNGQFAGAFLGSGFLGIDKNEAVKRMLKTSGGAVEENKIRDYISLFTVADSEYVKALAEMLLLCAKHVSVGAGDYHQTLKRRAKQQSYISEQIAMIKSRYPSGTQVPCYQLEKENSLLHAVKQGDHETSINTLNELIGTLLYANPDQFKPLQFRAMELVVLLSRAAIIPGEGEDAVMEFNNLYLERIQEAQGIEELTDVLHIILERMIGQIFSFHGIRHASALQKAERFIKENYSRKIGLKEIALESGLSAPYFSTIFKEEMGENLSSYLNRLRVEKATRLLTSTRLTLSEIAGSCGFEDQSWFSKIFKAFMGISPGKYRSRGCGIVEITERNFAANLRKADERTAG